MKKKMYQFAAAGFVMLLMYNCLNASDSSQSGTSIQSIISAVPLTGSWEALGTGMDGTINDIEAASGQVYAVGDFLNAGGTSAVRAARWNGNQWLPMGDGIYGGDYAEGEPPDWADPSVNEVCKDGSNIYAGGFFRNAGAVSVMNVARWDGAVWSAMGGGLGGWYNNIDGVYALEVSSQTVYGAGACWSQGNIAKWDGNDWVSLNDNATDWNTPYCITVSGNDVYVGGSFTQLRDLAVQHIGRYDEVADTWSTLGSPGAEGTDQPVSIITAMGSTVYAGGPFTSAGGVTVNHFARWDKNTGLWSAFGLYPGDGSDIWVTALKAYGSSLYAAVLEGGWSKLLKWDGSTWYLISDQINGTIKAISIDGSYVYAAGSFTSVDGLPANRIARWHQASTIPEFYGFIRITTGDVVTDDGTSVGCAWGDYNNDGYDDLFIANEDNQNNFLYTNNGDGTFSKVTTGPVVSNSGRSFAGAWGDMDNDGDLDLYVANMADQINFLYSNNGDGSFTRITSGAVVTDAYKSWGCAWADYNNDGNLDLFVANMAGDNNCLYTGHGDGTFTKVTTGDIVNDGGSSASAAWCDYDLDGDMDLFVANTEDQDNFFYTNNGDGTFFKVTNGPAVSDGGESWSASWGDYDNDGYPDLFVGNNNEPNFLYHNEGYGIFSKITTGTVVTDSYHTRSSCWGDIDKDGLIDLVATNKDELTCVYINDGSGLFVRYSLGITDARGCALSDFDTDGDADLCIVNNGSNNILYENTAASGSHWLSIRCIGTMSNRSALGAKVKVKAASHGTPVWQTRQIAMQTGFAGQSSLDVNFGLGEAATVDSIQILWPGGLMWDSTNVASDQRLVVTEQTPFVNHSPVAADDSVTVNENGTVSVHVLSNDSDPDGDDITIQSIDLSGTLGTATVDAGDTTVTYAAPADYSGWDGFAYSISDGNGGLDTANVYIEILAVNHPPVAVNDTLTIKQDSTVTIYPLINDSDPDGDVLTIAGVLDSGVSGTVVVNSGDTSVSYIPPVGFSGDVDFDYVVSDGNGGLDTAAVFITITPISSVSDRAIPTVFALHQNHPNPFNPLTQISYSIADRDHVRLGVYDITGREMIVLVDEIKSPGNYTADFNGSALSSGVYVYRLEAGGRVITRKMVLIK